MVESDVMVTTGHYMWHNSFLIRPIETRIYVKQNSGTLNTAYYEVKTYTLSTAYINTLDSNHDWSILKLKMDIGTTQTGWFGYGYGSKIVGKSVAISGYPGSIKYYQYGANGIVSSSTSSRFNYDVDKVLLYSRILFGT